MCPSAVFAPAPLTITRAMVCPWRGPPCTGPVVAWPTVSLGRREVVPPAWCQVTDWETLVAHTLTEIPPSGGQSGHCDHCGGT